jgi:hypothetical protein
MLQIRKNFSSKCPSPQILIKIILKGYMLLKAMIVPCTTVTNNEVKVFLPLRKLTYITAEILPVFLYAFFASL